MKFHFAFLVFLIFTKAATAEPGNSLQYNKFLEDWDCGKPQSFPHDISLPSSSPDWQKLLSNYEPLDDKVLNSAVNFAAVYNGGSEKRNRNLCAVASTSITTSKTQTCVLAVGCDERLLVYLNSKLVGDFHGSGQINLDEFKTTITLNKGRNSLKLISVNTRGEWGALARLLPVSFNREYKLLYHLHPFPAGLSDVPEARLTFLDKNERVLAREAVGAWREAASSTDCVYKCYFTSENVPTTVTVDVAVPYLGLNYKAQLPWDKQMERVGRYGIQNVWGKVLDLDSETPIVSATLNLKGSTHAHATSDAKGAFHFANIDAAFSEIEVSIPGYISDTFAYQVNELFDKNLRLEKNTKPRLIPPNSYSIR